MASFPKKTCCQPSILKFIAREKLNRIHRKQKIKKIVKKLLLLFIWNEISQKRLCQQGLVINSWSLNENFFLFPVNFKIRYCESLQVETFCYISTSLKFFFGYCNDFSVLILPWKQLTLKNWFWKIFWNCVRYLRRIKF